MFLVSPLVKNEDHVSRQGVEDVDQLQVILVHEEVTHESAIVDNFDRDHLGLFSQSGLSVRGSITAVFYNSGQQGSEG